MQKVRSRRGKFSAINLILASLASHDIMADDKPNYFRERKPAEYTQKRFRA